MKQQDSGPVELPAQVVGVRIVDEEDSDVPVGEPGELLVRSVGADPRGGVVGTYVQRNALVVGFVMGFAIIPIIYTISEDALSTVPEHLRSASLGAGATPWQTATRIVIPTAMSGLFSAMMPIMSRMDSGLIIIML